MTKEQIEQAAGNLADPNICKNDNWIAGANWVANRMYSEEQLRNAVEISVAIALGASRFIINEESFEKLKKQIR